MKKFACLFTLSLVCVCAFSQAPQGITHQAVVRDAAGQLISNTTIGIRIAILQGTVDGTEVYSETHTPLSNSNGLVNFVVGQGNVLQGIFSLIDWNNGPFFIKVEADPDGGSNYLITGTSQLLSVPYAFNSTHANALTLTDDNGQKYEIRVDTTGNLFASPILPWACGDDMTDLRDGNVYSTVLIGNQCWMKQNLAYLPSVSPSLVGSYTENCYYVFGYQGFDVTEARMHENYSWYGVLYNWPAAMTACPSGWHLADFDDWTELIDFLGGWEPAGGKMKSTRTDPDPHPRWELPNTSAINTSNFTGLPGGLRYEDGNFSNRGWYGSWWVGLEETPMRAYHNNLGYDMHYIYRGANEKQQGFSVRCLKDE